MKAPSPKPPLGWNSFDCYGIFANERVLLANLDAFERRLKPHGYEYFVLDAGWYSHFTFQEGREFPVDKRSHRQSLDAWGRCIPAPHLFPNGLRPIVDRAHRKGIKFGIHIMRGIPRQAVDLNLPIQDSSYHARDIANREDMCPWNEVMYGIDMSCPGGQAYYDSVVRYLAEDLDVDFIKADDIAPFPDEVKALATAIEKVRKPVMLSLSPGNHVSRVDRDIYRLSNMLRISGDVWDTREDLHKCFERWEMWQNEAGPDFWPDLDMIPFGALQVYADLPASAGDELLAGKGKKRNCQLTLDEKRSFITMRALAASPLFMGGELTMTSDEDMDLITHPDILACNQNGVVGKQASFKKYLDVRHTPEKGAPHAGWIGVFNRNRVERAVTLNARDLGLETGRSYRLQDIWNGTTLPPFQQNLTVRVPPGGVLFMKFQGI